VSFAPLFISQVIIYFNSKLEQIQEKKERTLAVSEVQDVIRQTAMQFPKEKLTVRIFPIM
jgi:hypothetical protein